MYVHMLYMYLLDISVTDMYEAIGTRELYQPIQSCHVVYLGISNKSVTVPRQDSNCLCRAHAVLSGHCDTYII